MGPNGCHKAHGIDQDAVFELNNFCSCKAKTKPEPKQFQACVMLYMMS